MAGYSDAQDFAAQIAALTAKICKKEEKFERLEAENTTIKAENVELLVRVETILANTTPLAEIQHARFRVPVNPMQPLEEETTPIASNVHQTQVLDPFMGVHAMPRHFEITTVSVVILQVSRQPQLQSTRSNVLTLGDKPSSTPLLICPITSSHNQPQQVVIRSRPRE